ncbi:MAG TPA: tetratricopeptide repeat protein [Candidatus Acidoferrales bacterium]
MTEKSRIEQFKELLALDPDDPLVHYGLGSEYLKTKEYAEAVACFRRVLELKPDYSAAYRELGKALEGTGETQAAAEMYRKGKEVAGQKGDIQTIKEMDVFLRRIERTESGGL